MCTVGFVRIKEGFIVFKNRDLPPSHTVDNSLTFVSMPDTHFLAGVNIETTQSEGVSIGVNKHGVCVANTHAYSSSDITYDHLCGEILNHVRKAEDLAGTVEDYMRGKSLQGGKILVVSRNWAYLVEVFKDKFAIKEQANYHAMTNHYELLPLVKKKIDRSSVIRRRNALDALLNVEAAKDLKSLLRSHVPSKGKCSICVHGGEKSFTESSHIIEIVDNKINWHYLTGNPCENDYMVKTIF